MKKLCYSKVVLVNKSTLLTQTKITNLCNISLQLSIIRAATSNPMVRGTQKFPFQPAHLLPLAFQISSLYGTLTIFVKILQFRGF